MLIFLQGSDSFLAREAISSLKKKYLEKNPAGTEMVEIDASDFEPTPTTPRLRGASWADLKAVPLFATSRLIIIRRAGELVATEQDNLSAILANLPESSIVVVWDAKPLKANSALWARTHKATKKIDVKPLVGAELATWIKKQSAIFGHVASPEMIKELVSQYGSDLWAIQTDLMSRQGSQMTSDWGRQKAAKPFILFDDVRSKRWPELKEHLIAGFERGEALEMSMGSLAAAVRQSISDESQRRQIVSILTDVDLALKTGLIEAADAVALLVYYLPNHQKRVQWEELCEQII